MLFCELCCNVSFAFGLKTSREFLFNSIAIFNSFQFRWSWLRIAFAQSRISWTWNGFVRVDFAFVQAALNLFQLMELDFFPVLYFLQVFWIINYHCTRFLFYFSVCLFYQLLNAERLFGALGSSLSWLIGLGLEKHVQLFLLLKRQVPYIHFPDLWVFEVVEKS